MQRLLTSRVSLTSILTQTVLFLGSATDSIQSGKSPSRSCKYRVACVCGSSFACTAAFSSFLVPGITVQEVWGCVRPCCCAVSHQHVLHLFRHYGLQQDSASESVRAVHLMATPCTYILKFALLAVQRVSKL